MPVKRIILDNFVFYIILALLACGNDNPLSPELKVNPPGIILLAQGAHWKYEFSYSKQWSGNRKYSETHTGTMEIDVKNEEKGHGAREYSLETHFIVEKSVISQSGDSIPVSTNTFLNTLDTTLSYTIVYTRDTLWYFEGNDSSEFMMPGSFTPGSGLNLKLFNFPRSDAPLYPVFFSVPFTGGKDIQTHYIYSDWDSGSGGFVFKREAYLEKKRGGISFLEAIFNSGGKFLSNGSSIKYTLVEYIPGQSVL